MRIGHWYECGTALAIASHATVRASFRVRVRTDKAIVKRCTRAAEGGVLCVSRLFCLHYVWPQSLRLPRVASQQSKNSSPAIAPSRDDVTAFQREYDGSRMWRRAEIRVIPLEQAERNRAALESLRNRVAQAERESASLWLVDSNVRQQLSLQVQLMRELLTLAEQQQSQPGEESECARGGTPAEPTAGSDDVRSVPQRDCGTKSRCRIKRGSISRGEIRSDRSRNAARGRAPKTGARCRD